MRFIKSLMLITCLSPIKISSKMDQQRCWPFNNLLRQGDKSRSTKQSHTIKRSETKIQR